jgi:hypothetical protein
MKRIRRAIAAVLIAVLTYGILGSSLYGVFAAVMPVTITVDKFENGKLDLNWTQLSGAAAAVVSYHKPDTNSTTDAAILITSNATGSSISIAGLETDYIYDISVVIYGAVDSSGNPAGSPIGRGLLFYLPSMSFTSSPISQAFDTVTGGGREIGAKPKMKLEWKIPKVYYSGAGADNNKFIKANRSDALQYMQDRLTAVYNDGRELSTLNFRMNISTQLNLLNSGSAQAALLVDQQSGGVYHASVSGSSAATATVTTPNALDYVGFDLWGRADASSAVPTSSSIYVLPDNDIYPGTVYYMNIKPIFKDSHGANVNAITVGNPSDQNGSLLLGDVSYASTPIRFQLTKDSANNIYVKIYKINQGSLDLPRLFYQVQATDDPAIQGDWAIKKTMDDSYFSGPTAVTIITGVNPNNQVFYKIVVKSDSAGDKLESLPMPYTLSVDTSRPPLPTGIALQNRTLDIGQVTPPTGTAITVKSTDVTISWDKPLNWSTIKNNLYYHFLLNTNQAEISTDVPLYAGDTFWGNYPAKYRLVKYVSAASPNIIEVGNRLSYTIKAYDLFKWEDSAGSSSGHNITHTAGYPDFFIPNTTYFAQMYTTTATDMGTGDTSKMSDKSIVFSFTTLNGVERDVPLPMSFALDGNGKTASPVKNFIELKFDKVTNLDWKNYTDNYDETLYSYHTYYDIYMNTRTDTPFTLIGTTEKLNADIGFTGADDPQSTSVKARISEFTTTSAIELFGHNLLPNTTYYFKAKTRLAVRSVTNSAIITTKDSIDTAILPVTTVVLTVTPPDDSQRKPLAPTDFDIALDESQSPVLSGNSVTFTWRREENDVIYQLIRTTQKVSPTDSASSYGNDPEYVSFLKEYDSLSDGAANDRIYLDPAPLSGHLSQPGEFQYNPSTKICTYKVDRRMFPNKLYYFSLKAVRVNSQRVPLTTSSESVWVSVPVTTSLIEAPASLEVVVASELGFFWKDSTAGLTAEDYKIYAKISSESDYKLMNRSQATIIKDMDGETYYGRITGLKINTYYDIRVTKGTNTPVYEKSGFKTRDGYHELEIKWKGKSVDSFSRYDIALMEEGSKDYTILTASDLEQYAVKNGAVLPYYTEETALTVGSDELYYHARIRSAQVELAGGIVTHQPLRSNIKYFIKVRSVKIDPTETDFIAYSKYIGPVSTRTEFNQGDYDNTDREEKQKAVFLDRMDSLEKGYFWRLSISDGSASRILLKGDRVADALKNSAGDSFTVDMTQISVNINKDEIYVPVIVVKAMNSLNKNLVIRTTAAELLLRPATLDASANDQMKEILGREGVKDLYVRVIIARSTTSSTAPPSTLKRVSDINELDVQAWGLSATDSDLKKMFHDKLYDKDNGLVNEKLDMLQNTYVGEGTGSSALIDQYTQSLVELIEKELSTYIDSTLQSVKLSNAVRDITVFGAPATASLSTSSSKGVKLPYVLYDDSATWQKLSASIVQSGSSVRLNLIKTGKYVILTAQSDISDVPAGHWAESSITTLTSKYDLSDVFTGINSGFMPENKATCTEVILLYEKVTGKTSEDAGLDIRQKTAKLGLDGFIGSNSLARNVRRQETAAVLLKLFAAKKGVSTGSLKPGGNVDIADESGIDDNYYNPVVLIVDMKVMSLDDSGKFYPVNQMTRAELAVAFVRLLELAGE